MNFREDGGDDQPKRRRCKRKKKYIDAKENSTQQHCKTALETSKSVLRHKENDFCSKYIILIITLIIPIVIGLLVTEHNGFTKLDISFPKSRFVSLFGNWIGIHIPEEGEHIEKHLGGTESEQNELENEVDGLKQQEVFQNKYGEESQKLDQEERQGQKQFTGNQKDDNQALLDTSTGTNDGINNLENAPHSQASRDKPLKSEVQNYVFSNITNLEDYLIKDDLDNAQKVLSNNVALALSMFIKILDLHPESPRALYGRAQSLDHLANKKRSNEIVKESIKYYLKVLVAKNVPDALFLLVADRCIERMRFVGNYVRAVEVHQQLIERFPSDIRYRNEYAVTLLTINRISQARTLLLETLQKWPEDGFALVHYGFILKTVDNNLPLAISYLTKGIDTKEPGVIDGRFYFHLGDALTRLGKNNEAMRVYEDGVVNHVFLSKYQRSLYNVNTLTGRPWWRKEQTPYDKLYRSLQLNWKKIRDEGLAVLSSKGYFKDESENLRDVGDWKQFELYARGVKNKENCNKCPITCQIIDSNPEARSCKRGQVKFSVMHPGTHVWPHCGPTNCRLRVHLGLKVPPDTYIRVAEETRSWKEGDFFIFDDSFEHEVWHNGRDFRLVLIVDVWHPELTKSERANLSSI